MPGRTASTALNVALTALLALVFIVPTAWYLLYLTFADRWWWLFVGNSLAPIMFMPVPMALLVAWLTKRRQLAAVGLVPVAIATMLWAGSLLPAKTDGPAVVDAQSTITVMTYNVMAGDNDPDAIVGAILASGAQVVALQELNGDVGLELAERLEATHPYYDLAPCPACGDWGSLGLFSAFPVEAVSADLGGPSTRNPQTTLLHHPRGDVLIVNVHNLSTPRFPQIWPEEITRAVTSREAVAVALVELVSSSEVPVIALGDFNTTERSGAYRTLVGQLTDTWRRAGFGFGSTFHGGPRASGPWRLALPAWLLRIDYVFHSRELSTVAVKMQPWSAASDHRPVSAVVAFRD